MIFNYQLILHGTLPMVGALLGMQSSFRVICVYFRFLLYQTGQLNSECRTAKTRASLLILRKLFFSFPPSSSFLKQIYFLDLAQDEVRESGLVFRTLLYWSYSHLNSQLYSEVLLKGLSPWASSINILKKKKKTELNLLRFCFIMPSGQEAGSNKMPFTYLLSYFKFVFGLSISCFLASSLMRSQVGFLLLIF